MKFLVPIIILLNALHSNASGIYNQIPFPPNDTAYYCFITDVFNEGGENYIKVRKVQIFTGLNAIEEAKKDGRADYSVGFGKIFNDTSWYLPNEYYIAEREKNESKLLISDKVEIDIYSYEVKKKISVDELINNSFYYKVDNLYNKYTHERSEEIAYLPFEIIIENGKVNIISQFKDW